LNPLRCRIGLAVTHHARHDQLGIVEHGPERMTQRIAELAALVDRTRTLRRRVARDPAGKRKLQKQFAKAGLVLADVRIDLAVGALEVGVGDHCRAAMPRARDVDHVDVVFLDDAIQMDVDEVLSRSRAPVPEQHVLHVRERKRALQERIVVEIELADRQIVGGAPVGLHLQPQVWVEGAAIHGLGSLRWLSRAGTKGR